MAVLNALADRIVERFAPRAKAVAGECNHQCWSNVLWYCCPISGGEAEECVQVGGC